MPRQYTPSATYVCEQCQQTFQRTPSHFHRARHHYCSVACRRLGRRIPYPQKCPPRSILPMPERFWSKVDMRGPADCWPWIAAVDRCTGYGNFYYQGRTRTAHRVALLLSGVTILPGLHVRHTCDNRICCNPAHLLLGTAADNVADRMARHRQRNTPSPGELNGQSRLTEIQVRQIRELRASGIGARELARRFPVGLTTIKLILNRKAWRGVV